MSQPNILLILIDDMGWKDISCMGSEFYETPNIDRLAQEGMTFTSGYASCPVCSPTRASLLTGKYPARVGVTNWIGGDTKGKLIDAPYVWELPLEEVSIAKALKDAGYATWHVGKWHLGKEPFWPDKHGFDVNVGGCHMGCPHHGYFSPWSIPTLPDGPEGEYLTDRIGDETVRLIESHDSATPFFLNLCFYQVHTPLQAKPEKIAKYEAKAKTMGLDKVQTHEEGDFYPCEHKKDGRIKRRLVQSHTTYAAMIESLDENVGKVLDALAARGMLDNTLIVFTSDNGGLSTSEGSPTCNAPLTEGKGWTYEGGIREPWLVRWPGVVAAGGTCDEPVTSPDIYPTFLEAAGAPLRPEQHVDGVSIMPLLKGEQMTRGAIYWHYPHYGNQGGTPGGIVREGDWKLIEFYEDSHVELYNLASDISEQADLAEADPERAEAMRAKLALWRAQVGAIMPKENPDFVPWRARPCGHHN
jgi:arylsulfatase A-like enzyme